VRGIFYFPFFDLEGFFFFDVDFVEVLLLGLLEGTVDMGSINLGAEALVSFDSETIVCLDIEEVDLLAMAIW